MNDTLKIIPERVRPKGWAFSMHGYTVSGDFAPPACGPHVCFVFSDMKPWDPKAEETWSTYGVTKIKVPMPREAGRAATQ